MSHDRLPQPHCQLTPMRRSTSCYLWVPQPNLNNTRVARRFCKWQCHMGPMGRYRVETHIWINKQLRSTLYTATHNVCTVVILYVYTVHTGDQVASCASLHSSPP